MRIWTHHFDASAAPWTHHVMVDLRHAATSRRAICGQHNPRGVTGPGALAKLTSLQFHRLLGMEVQVVVVA